MPTLPTITNPAPFTPGAMNQLWATVLRISGSALEGRLFPYDGTHFLGNLAAAVDISVTVAQNPSLATLIAAVLAAVAQISGKSAIPLDVRINGVDPNLPVTAVARFDDGTDFILPDLIALAQSNPQVASLYAQIIACVQEGVQ